MISGKEDPDAALLPAMVAVMRLSKQVIGLPEGDEDDMKSSGAVAVNCCVRLLVPTFIRSRCCELLCAFIAVCVAVNCCVLKSSGAVAVKMI